MTNKTLKIALITGTLAVGTALVVRAASAGRKIGAEVLGSIRGIEGEYFLVGLDLHLTNPTKTPFKISYPYIQIYIDGVKIAENRIKDQNIDLPANTSVRFRDQTEEDLILLIPYQTALLNLGPLVGQLVAGTAPPVEAEVRVMTSAYPPGLPGIPQTIKQTIQLNK